MIIDIFGGLLLLSVFLWLMIETKWLTIIILYGSPPEYIDISGLGKVVIGVIAYVVTVSLLTKKIKNAI